MRRTAPLTPEFSWRLCHYITDRALTANARMHAGVIDRDMRAGRVRGLVGIERRPPGSPSRRFTLSAIHPRRSRGTRTRRLH